MYKCGWNGCEKAYGTLNHLNAHVTMQSHGQKRIPEGMLPNNLLSAPALITRWTCGCALMSILSRLTACDSTNLIDGLGKG